MGTKALVSLAACVVVVMAFIGVRQAQPEGATSPEKPQPPTQAAPVLSPAGVPADQRPVDNSSCLLCHPSLAEEMITKAHAKGGTLCVDCHGLSTAHAAGEGLVDKADLLFGRGEIVPLCQKCHEAPHQHPDRVDAFIAEWQGRIRPNGRKVSKDSVCTDCHGAHHERDRQASAEWIPLFNGKDLTGWQAEGNAVWKVEKGMLIGTQGPNDAHGELLTTDTYRDFHLKVTYRVAWPANTGIWFRYQSGGQAYQADILEYRNPVAYSGTIYCPGKMFLAINDDPDLVNHEGWNTMDIRAEGPRLRVWLNGFQVADVKDDTTDHGRIGFQVHAGKEFEAMKIMVRQVLLQPLCGASR